MVVAILLESWSQIYFVDIYRAVQRVQDPFKPPESDRPEAQRVGLKPLAGRVRFLLSGNPNIQFGLRVKGLKTRTNRPDRSFKRKKKKILIQGRSRELRSGLIIDKTEHCCFCLIENHTAPMHHKFLSAQKVNIKSPAAQSN